MKIISLTKRDRFIFSGGKGKRNYRSPGYVKSTLAKNGYYIVHLDGSIVYRYPGDELFGYLGFYSYNLDRLLKHIDEWMELD